MELSFIKHDMIKNTLLPSMTATTLMTLFSHYIANLEEKNFSEPELLARIEKKALPRTAGKFALPAGWATHYSVGVLMNSFFNLIWQIYGIKPTFQRGMVSGGIGGLMSIAAWKLLFNALPRRSHDYYKKFYTQLFVAHLIFGVTALLTQKASKKLPA